MTILDLANPLLAWYAQHARELPWRVKPDPYAVWISEVMLQQTRVETVISYYGRWMECFPTVADLAAASQQDILVVWEGMGYYERARNLHHAAQMVMSEWGGELPCRPEMLRQLPGVGRYTAGAVASIAFGLDEPALDGNARRVLARIFNIAEPIHTSAGESRLWELAARHLPPGRAGDYNQALMDLGAAICTPRNPDCQHCPLSDSCQARALGIQEQLPVRRKKIAIPHHTVTAAIIFRESRVLIAQRPPDGLLGGLWEFPGGKLRPGEELHDCLQREIQEELGVDIQVSDCLGVYHHAYSHFRVTLHAFYCALVNGIQPRPIEAQDLRWLSLVELADYPMGKIDRQISLDLLAKDEPTSEVDQFEIAR